MNEFYKLSTTAMQTRPRERDSALQHLPNSGMDDATPTAPPTLLSSEGTSHRLSHPGQMCRLAMLEFVFVLLLVVIKHGRVLRFA